ncbi:membrane protein [Bacteroidia bacterium]|nr:membrane protein [Bacteroidia bacterium]
MLFFVQCGKNQANTPNEAVAGNDTLSQTLPIAYVDADSLLTHFKFYNNLISAYESKLSKHNNSLNSTYQKFQSEVIAFEQKAQNNAFLSQERMMQEQTRLQGMKQDIERRAAQAEQELALEQKLIQQQLSDSLALGIKEFNKSQKYQMIFTKAGLFNSNILYANEQYDITKDVLEFLNKRFKAD